MPKLIIVKNGQEKQAFTLDADTIQIGSGEGNAIRIQSDDISREHCELRRSGMQFRLVDLESKTGTRVNGAYVNQHLLDEGDEIQLGTVVFRYRRNGAPAPTLPVLPTAAPARRPAPRRPAAGRPAAGRGPGPGHRPPPRRASSAMPIVVVSLLVAAVLAIVVIAILGGGGERSLTRNESLLTEMSRLESRGLYRQARDQAVNADRNGDPNVLAKIDALVLVLDAQLQGSDARSTRSEARTAIERLLVRAKRERDLDQTAFLKEVDEALARFASSADEYYLAQLRQLRDDVVTGRIGADDPAGGGSIQARFEATVEAAHKLQDDRHYGQAIDLYGRFLDENQALLTSGAARLTYEKKVREKQEIIAEVAASVWQKVHDRAQWHLAQDRVDTAIGLYEKKIIGVFGIPMYEEKAAMEIKRIRAR